MRVRIESMLDLLEILYYILLLNKGNKLTLAFNFTPTYHPCQSNMLISHHCLIFPSTPLVTLPYTKIQSLNTSSSFQNLHLQKLHIL